MLVHHEQVSNWMKCDNLFIRWALYLTEGEKKTGFMDEQFEWHLPFQNH